MPNLDSLNTFSLILGILGSIGALGGVAGFFANGRAKTIIELQQQEITTREQREKTKDEEHKDEMLKMTNRMNECMAKASAAEAKAQVLQELAQQTPAIEQLIKLQGQQHTQVISGLSEVTKELSALTKALIDSNIMERRDGK